MPDGRVLYTRWEYVDKHYASAYGLWTMNPDGTAQCLYYGGYEDPYPLSEKYFLCSRSIARPQGGAPAGTMGLFLADLFGNELLLHVEGPGCFDPMPIAARERPPAIPSRVDLATEEGAFYVQDVYVGEWMADVPRGAVKYLRIVEAPPKKAFPPFGISDWTPALNIDGHHPVAVNWDHYNHKRVLGKVPVEVDGSAYFSVPADRFVYFQLLDENDMMIHSMRSGTTVQPGETAGCVGCHESRLHSVSKPGGQGSVPLALRREPSRIEPWYGPPRNFSYTAEVQPVWDKHCVSCHDYDGEDRGGFSKPVGNGRANGPAESRVGHQGQ